MRRSINIPILVITILLLGTAANAWQVAVDTVGCNGKRDLWVVLDHHDKSTTQAFINSGTCYILREGQQVKIFKKELFLNKYSMSQVKVGGKILWVLTDFLQ